MVFAFYLFAPVPLFHNPVETGKVAAGAHGEAWRALEERHAAAAANRADAARTYVAARRVGDAAATATAGLALDEAQRVIGEARTEAAALVKATDPGAQTSDTNYVFLGYVLRYLPVGMVGLVLACIFAASMNSTSSELNALASTTVVDVYKRLHRGDTDRHEVTVSRIATLAWTAFAVVFAEYASRLGSLIEAVNILGSLFYGTILGIFLTAFLLPRVGGTAVFVGALAAQAAVLACFRLTGISFLWYNLIGCAVVMAVGLLLSMIGGGSRAARAARVLER
jgi:hypothetical protein